MGMIERYDNYEDLVAAYTTELDDPLFEAFLEVRPEDKFPGSSGAFVHWKNLYFTSGTSLAGPLERDLYNSQKERSRLAAAKKNSNSERRRKKRLLIAMRSL